MKNKIEPKSWKEVAESLDAVDKGAVIAAYESGRKDELEAYYENAVWSKLRRVTNHVEQVERSVNAIRNRVGVPYEDDGDAWSWLRSLKTSMTTAWFVVVFNLILTLVLALKVL